MQVSEILCSHGSDDVDVVLLFTSCLHRQGDDRPDDEGSKGL
jgi:hypothetical protein